jgi:hypothetical protein
MEKSTYLKYQKGFSDELLNFLSYIDEIIPTEKTQMIINKYPKLNMTKLISRYAKIMQPLKEQLTNKDVSIFQKQLFIIPEFNVSFFWENLPDENKSKVWETLSRLLIYCNIILNNKTEEKPNLSNNPFFGVKGSNLSVSNIKESVNKSQSDSNPILQMLTDNLKIDKDKLQNLDEETITKMTSEVKNMISPHVDNDVSDLVENMVSGIGEELKNVDLTNGDIFSNVIKIAEKMSHKLTSDMTQNNFSPEKLLKSSKAIMKEIGVPEGTDMNQLMSNPASLLSMVTKMASKNNPTNNNSENNSSSNQTAAMIDMMSNLLKM